MEKTGQIGNLNWEIDINNDVMLLEVYHNYQMIYSNVILDYKEYQNIINTFKKKYIKLDNIKLDNNSNNSQKLIKYINYLYINFKNYFSLILLNNKINFIKNFYYF